MGGGGGGGGQDSKIILMSYHRVYTHWETLFMEIRDQYKAQVVFSFIYSIAIFGVVV